MHTFPITEATKTSITTFPYLDPNYEYYDPDMPMKGKSKHLFLSRASGSSLILIISIT